MQERYVASIEDKRQENRSDPIPAPIGGKVAPEEAKVGDLEIHLDVIALPSDMHYERRDGRNRLTLRFVELH